VPLSKGPPIPGWGDPIAVYVDPSGRFLYTGTHNNWGGSAIGQFRIGKDGQVTPLKHPSVSVPYDYRLVIVRLPAPQPKPTPKAKGRASAGKKRGERK
jgi:hypothetical protein